MAAEGTAKGKKGRGVRGLEWRRMNRVGVWSREGGPVWVS